MSRIIEILNFNSLETPTKRSMMIQPSVGKNSSSESFGGKLFSRKCSRVKCAAAQNFLAHLCVINKTENPNCTLGDFRTCMRKEETHKSAQSVFISVGVESR